MSGPAGALERLQGLLAGGKDGPALRFGLGSELLRLGRCDEAAAHLRRALELDAGYSAAWKLLGRALEGAGDAPGAAEAYRSGIASAQARGDVQAAKEMNVFLRRIERSAGGPPATPQAP